MDRKEKQEQNVYANVAETRAFTKMTEISEEDISAAPVNILHSEPDQESLRDRKTALVSQGFEEETEDDAIEVTVVANTSKFDQIQRDIERSIKDNEQFRQNVKKNILDEVTKQTNQVMIDNAAAIKVQQVSVVKGRMSIVRKLVVILLLILIFVALIVTFLPNIQSNFEKWPQMQKFKKGDIVELDLGGTHKIKVEYSQLLQVPDSKLYDQFSGELQVEEDGTVFVNRPYIGFKHLIDFLRNNREIPEMPTQFEQKMFDFELNFWNIQRRIKSQIELDLEKMFAETPKDDMILQETIDQWKQLGNFDLSRYINQKVITIDQQYQIKQINLKDIINWTGQSQNDEPNGVGRGTGGFGIYEGQQFDGNPNGFGRLIFRNKNYYQGTFADGAITGDGTYTDYSSNITYSGYWVDGVLQKSAHPDQREGEKVIEPLVPKSVVPTKKHVISLTQSLNQTPNFKIENSQDLKIFNALKDKFEELGPINVKKLEDRGVLTIDPSQTQGAIAGPDFKYNGQTKILVNKSRLLSKTDAKVTPPHFATKVSHGLGTLAGIWGIYQGMFNEGTPHGYGRIIYQNLNFYEGMFDDGKFDGEGKYVFANKTAIEGQWKSGVLVTSIAYDKQEGFAPQDGPIPIALRLKSQLERDLEIEFELPPVLDGSRKQLRDLWSSLGPYALENSIDAGEVSLDYPFPSVDLKLQLDSQSRYVGQTYVPKFIYTDQDFNNTIFENLQNLSVNQGVGRTLYPWGIFEGTKVSEIQKVTVQGRYLFNDGRYEEGTVVMPTSNQSQQSISLKNKQEGLNEQEFLYLVKGSFLYDIKIIEKTENDLISIFSKKLSRWKNPEVFDLEKLVIQQVVAVDKDLTVFNDTESGYWGQMDNNKQYQGLGRKESFSEVYEGEFLNGEYHGTGRRIFPNGANFTVQNGYFQKGKYVAKSLGTFKLQNLFNSEPSQLAKDGSLSKLWKTEGAFDLDKYLENGQIRIQTQNVSMYYDATLYNKQFDGASLNLIKTSFFGFDPKAENGGAAEWEGQYSYFQQEKYTKGIGRYIEKDFVIEGDLERFGRILYSDGSVYVGILPREYSRGEGKLVLEDGTKMEGIWSKGEFQGRTQYPSELKFQKSLDLIPDNERVPLATLQKWKDLGPINLKQVLDFDLMDNPFVKDYSENDFQQQLITNNFQYLGLMSKTPEANGLGRAQGQWGIYEGNFQNGKAQGYGRVIYNDTSFFEGLFDNSLPTQSLTLTPLCDSQNKTIEGQPTGQQCYSVAKTNVSKTYLAVQTIKRIQSQEETELIRIFDKQSSQADRLKYNFTSTFNLSTYNLQNYINNQKIKFNDSLEVAWFIDNKTNFKYEGQMNRDGKIAGIGRMWAQWGVYTGQYVDQRTPVFGQVTFNDGSYYQGMLVGFAFSGNGQFFSNVNSTESFQGTWQNNQLIDSQMKDKIGFAHNHQIKPQIKRSQSKEELQLITIFSSPLSHDEYFINFPQKVFKTFQKSGPFALRKEMDQGMGFLVEEGSSWTTQKSNDGNYNGQFFQNGSEQLLVGVGRHQGIWGLFEGRQYLKGYGREYGRMIWSSGIQYIGYFDQSGVPNNGTFIIENQQTRINSSILLEWGKDQNLNEYNFADMFVDIFGVNVTTEIFSDYKNPSNPSVLYQKLSDKFNLEPQELQMFIFLQWVAEGFFDFDSLLKSRSIDFLESDSAQYCTDYIETSEQYTPCQLILTKDACLANSNCVVKSQVNKSGQNWIARNGQFAPNQMNKQQDTLNEIQCLTQCFKAQNECRGYLWDTIQNECWINQNSNTISPKFETGTINYQARNGSYYEKVWCQDETLRGYNNSGYQGCQTRSLSGKKCMNWQDVKYKVNLPFGKLPTGQNNNYCRNPQPNKMDDIWCVTSLNQNEVVKEKCKPILNGPKTVLDINNFDENALDVSMDQNEIKNCNYLANEKSTSDFLLKNNKCYSNSIKPLEKQSVAFQSYYPPVPLYFKIKQIEIEGRAVESGYERILGDVIVPGTGNKLNGIYEGQTLNSKYDGYGRIITEDLVIEGQFTAGKMNGYGSMKYSNGTIIKGIWQDNQYQGNLTNVLLKFHLNQKLFKSQPLAREESSDLWNQTVKKWIKSSRDNDIYFELENTQISDSTLFEYENSLSRNQMWQGTLDYNQNFFANNSISYSYGRLSLFSSGDLLQGKFLSKNINPNVMNSTNMQMKDLINGCALRSNGNRECGNFMNNLLHGSGDILYSNQTFVEGHYEKGVYKKTIYRHKFDTIMISVPQQQYVNNDTIFKWTQLGPVNITLLEEMKIIKPIQENVQLVNESTSDGQMYIGQNKTLGGIGRLVTKEGSVIEGEFEKGMANGYVRIINNNKDVFEGRVSNGLKQGFGNMTLKSGILKDGFWNQDVYYRYEDWFKLILIFNSTPQADSLPQNIIEQWNKEGKFPIEQLYLDQKISLDQSSPVSTFQLDLSPTLNGIFSGQTVNGEASVGRLITSNSIREGNFKSGIIRIINDQLQIYSGPAINGEPQGLGKYSFANGTVQNGYMDNGVYYQSEYLYNLTSVFARKPKSQEIMVDTINKWDSLGRFDLMKHIKDGKINITSQFEISEKSIGNLTYFGQITKQGISGIGMKVGKNIEEGVFINNSMTGFGRIIYDDQSWYIGQISNSIRNGFGILTLSNGTSKNRHWVNDQVDCKDAFSNLESGASLLKTIQYTQNTTRASLDQKATLFFKTNDPSHCFLKKCEIKPQGCEGNYQGNVTILDDFSIQVNSNNENGWNETICVLCSGTGVGDMEYDDVYIQQSKCQIQPTDSTTEEIDACPKPKVIAPIAPISPPIGGV